jgi:tRNA pseudouridine13 synthase
MRAVEHCVCDLREAIPSEGSEKVVSREYGFRHTDSVKLKRLPDDFQVEELSEFRPTGAGEFALYRLTKRGLGTPEAIEAVSSRWKIARRLVSYGGLKDRHAESRQYLTIRRGPRRNLRQTNLELEYLGQVAQPFTSREVTGNRFQIVLRSLCDRDVLAARAALHEICRDGLPNYFDDQRFGSLGQSGEFVARAWIAGHYERALWLALADANPLDRSRDRTEKRLLRENWGDWSKCRAGITSPQRRSVVRLLCDRPSDFRAALAHVRHDLRSLYVSAFQSFLWNRLLASYIMQLCTAPQLVPVALKSGTVPFFVGVSDEVRAELQATQLPLPSSRIKLDESPLSKLLTRSLAELGLTLREIRIKYPRDSFFSKGARPAVFFVKNLSHDTAPDALHSGQSMLRLRFDLPRGSYATILVKRIAIVASSAAQGYPANSEEAICEEESQSTD